MPGACSAGLAEVDGPSPFDPRVLPGEADHLLPIRAARRTAINAAVRAKTTGRTVDRLRPPTLHAITGINPVEGPDRRTEFKIQEP